MTRTTPLRTKVRAGVFILVLQTCLQCKKIKPGLLRWDNQWRCNLVCVDKGI